MKKNDHIAWKWANGIAEGTVESVHTEKTTITSKGKQITRNGTSDNPALIITHTSGSKVLKLASEVEATKASAS